MCVREEEERERGVERERDTESVKSEIEKYRREWGKDCLRTERGM